MENEEGSDTVENILRTKKLILPAIVLLEVYYTSIQRRNLEIAQQRYAILKSLPAQHLPELSEPILLKSGEFKANYSISLADAVIAACASIFDATLIHKDPEYEAIKIIRQMRLPYKSGR